jgi:amino acid permease
MLFPLIVFYIIPISGFVAGIMGLVFGIISDHPFWGMVFTLFFGIFIAFGNNLQSSVPTRPLLPVINISLSLNIHQFLVVF